MAREKSGIFQTRHPPPYTTQLVLAKMKSISNLKGNKRIQKRTVDISSMKRPSKQDSVHKCSKCKEGHQNSGKFSIFTM